MAIVEPIESSADARRKYTLRSPATLEPIGEFEVRTREEVDAALARARAAQPAWAALSVAERCKYMERVLERVIARQDDIIETVCRETGKPRLEGLMMEVFAVCDTIGYYTKHAKRILKERKKRMHLMSPMKKLRLVPSPLGVVGVITPWNGPFVLSMNPSVQALLAGNAVLLKPSEITPYSGLLTEEIFREAGIPDGLFQCLLGDDETGQALLECGVDKISFTGSVATGRKIGEACARQLIPCTLELGGKDPFIVCKDANLERAAAGAVFGACMNSGQVCMSAERFYVVDEVADEFTRLVVEKAKNVRQDGRPDSDVGSIFCESQLDIIEAHVADAVQNGAKALVGGRKNPDLQGLYFEPTVLADVTQDMLIAKEETFGPIIAIIRVKDEEEAIRLANYTNYGLTASVWTKDEEKGVKYARRLDAGSVAINDSGLTYGVTEAQFGGVKNSGVGAVNGENGLLGYCNVKPIIIDRFGRDKEMQWYPYTAETEDQLKKTIKFLWGSKLWKLIS